MLFEENSREYKLIRDWIAQGTKNEDMAEARANRIEVLPAEIELDLPGRQQRAPHHVRLQTRETTLRHRRDPGRRHPDLHLGPRPRPAVLDATGTSRAVLVAHCHANWCAIDFADSHPERVEALIAIDPGVPYLGVPQPHWVETAPHWDDILDDPQGWELNNRHVYVTRHRDWVEFFFGSQLVEPHSSKQFEDAVSWALETTGEILADSEEAQDLDPPTREELASQVAGLDKPVLVIHGDRDVCQHVDKGRGLAEALTGLGYVALENGDANGETVRLDAASPPVVHCCPLTRGIRSVAK